jgi:protein-S-isoprenylcysteine O-methyltransferase Ste14
MSKQTQIVVIATFGKNEHVKKAFWTLFIAIIEVLFIPDEERVLEEHFGEEYREYTRGVRRWV